MFARARESGIRGLLNHHVRSHKCDTDHDPPSENLRMLCPVEKRLPYNEEAGSKSVNCPLSFGRS